MYSIVMVLVLNISLVSLSNIPGIFRDETMSPNNPDSISQLTALIGMQDSTIVVFDETYEYSATALSSVIGANQRIMLYEYNAFYAFLGPHMKRVLETTTLDKFRSQLNFLVMCELQCIQSVMSTVTELDNTIGLRSLLRHFSTWLIISHDPLPYLNTNLDNVGFIRLDLNRIRCLQVNIEQTNITCHETNEKVVKNDWKVHIFTLLWMPGGTEWSRVHSRAMHDDTLHSAVFPNTYRGLNGRKLVLSTLEEADTCPAPYLMSLERKLVMDFSLTVDSYGHFALYRRRTDDTYSWVYLVSCLPWQVYLCGSASLLWTLLLFTCANTGRNRRMVIPGTRHFSAYFEIVTHIPFRQGIQNIPEHISSKVILLTWCIFCMVMTTAYTCNLVAFAAVDKHTLPFNTLRELAERDEYAVGIIEAGYAEDILKNTNDSTNKMLYKKSHVLLNAKGDNYTTEERLNDILGKLYDEKFAILVTKNTKAAIRSQTCEIVTMKEGFFPADSGYVFPLHSPLKKLFNKQLSLLLDMGLLDRWVQKWTPEPMKCDTSRNVPQFKLDHLKTILVTCTVGILVAAVVLFVEMWQVQKRKQRRMHSTNNQLETL